MSFLFFEAKAWDWNRKFDQKNIIEDEPLMGEIGKNFN